MELVLKYSRTFSTWLSWNFWEDYICLAIRNLIIFSIKLKYLKIQQVIKDVIYKASIHLIPIHISYWSYLLLFFFFLGEIKWIPSVALVKTFMVQLLFLTLTAITTIKGKTNNRLFCNFYRAHNIFHTCEILTLVSWQEFFCWLQLPMF